jgi:hypothetical protein
MHISYHYPIIKLNSNAASGQLPSDGLRGRALGLRHDHHQQAACELIQTKKRIQKCLNLLIALPAKKLIPAKKKCPNQYPGNKHNYKQKV